jgi:hypothetical protein
MVRPEIDDGAAAEIDDGAALARGTRERTRAARRSRRHARHATNGANLRAGSRSRGPDAPVRGSSLPTAFAPTRPRFPGSAAMTRTVRSRFDHEVGGTVEGCTILEKRTVIPPVMAERRRGV